MTNAMLNNEEFKPVLEQEQFEGIHEAVDKVREGTEYVRVNKQALTNLLMDHSELWRILEIQ